MLDRGDYAVKYLLARHFMSNMTFKLSNLLHRNILWNTAIYVEEAGFEPGDPLSTPSHLLSGKRLWRGIKKARTIADPFLFVFQDKLYLFLEAEPEIGHGRIDAYESTDLRTFDYLGEILSEKHHLSYPFVFDSGAGICMIPESYDAGAVVMYEFRDFPFRPEPRRMLLEGRFVDSSLLRKDDIWFLFTTSDQGLEIYYTDDIWRGRLLPHPLNPIVRDPAYSRCGGAPLICGERIYRLAQDCSVTYGGNLHLMKIDEISPERYSESLIRRNLFDCSNSWNSLGGHHMSAASFQGKTIVAVDGKQHDFYVHRILGGLVRKLSR